MGNNDYTPNELTKLTELPGFTFLNHYISEDGRIWKIASDGIRLLPRKLHETVAGMKYFRVNNSVINLAKLIAVWKVNLEESGLLEDYKSVKDSGYRVRMVDGDKSNCRFDNIEIEWSGVKQNKGDEIHKRMWRIRMAVLLGQSEHVTALAEQKTQNYVRMLNAGFDKISDESRELLIQVCRKEAGNE